MASIFYGIRIICSVICVSPRYFRSGAGTGEGGEIMLDKSGICGIMTIVPAGVAHLAERHLAKVEVASSNLVARSIMF